MNIVKYPIVEIFHSVQGEGAWAGASASFIRLAGCDVHCPWCDQKETWSTKNYPLYSVEDIVQSIENNQSSIVVVTGGEPLRHDLSILTDALAKLPLKQRVHLETSGAHPFTGTFDWVTFSPKRYKPPHESIYEYVNELKVVVEEAQDFQWAEAEAAKVSSEVVKYLQPQWYEAESTKLVVDYVINHPQWRVSLQTHKFLGVR